MFTHDFSPIAVQLGPLAIRYYGLLFAAAVLVSMWLAGRIAREKNINLGKDGITNLAFYLVIGALIGARLGSVLSEFSYYAANPAQIIAVWNGGLAFHGGLVGMILAGLLFSRRHNIPFMTLADLVVIPVPLALAIGRVGNFMNAEFYGTVTNLPWGVIFPTAAGARHPVQLYESAAYVILFAALFLLRKKQLPQGTLLWTFIGSYGIIRFALEYLKDLPPLLFSLTWGQLWSIPMVLAALWAAKDLLKKREAKAE